MLTVSEKAHAHITETVTIEDHIKFLEQVTVKNLTDSEPTLRNIDMAWQNIHEFLTKLVDVPVIGSEQPTTYLNDIVDGVKWELYYVLRDTYHFWANGARSVDYANDAIENIRTVLVHLNLVNVYMATPPRCWDVAYAMVNRLDFDDVTAEKCHNIIAAIDAATKEPV